jgi:parallel beta-helix repeat protein
MKSVIIKLLVICFVLFSHTAVWGQDCPPDSEPRNCGGDPPVCECYQYNSEKQIWYKVAERPIKPGDRLEKTTVLSQDYFLPEDYEGNRNFYLEVAGITFDGGNHTIDGISIQAGKPNCTIQNITLKNGRADGIHLYDAAESTVNNCTIQNSRNGIRAEKSEGVTVTNNKITGGGGGGVRIYQSDASKVTGNEVTEKTLEGIVVINSNDVLVNNNKIISNKQDGIYWAGTSQNGTIAFNRVDSNSGRGIVLSEAGSDNVVDNNTLTSNNSGITIQSTSYATVTNNMISKSEWAGLSLLGPAYDDGLINWGCKVTGNTVSSGERAGVELLFARNATLERNTMNENKENFAVYGWDISEYTHSIDSTNTINGKPIYYWVSRNSGQIPEDAGFIGIVRSSNIQVRNLTITNNYPGVLLAFTNDSVVENMTVKDNTSGIFLYNSSNNRVIENVADNNKWHSIYLYKSDNNSVSGNMASFNRDWGIELRKSGGNTIHSNMATSNGFDGIYLWEECSGNTISGNETGTNKRNGIRITGGSNLNTIGGVDSKDVNVFSGNLASGLRIDGQGTDGNVIIGNVIGTGKDGNTVLPNAANGIEIKDGAAKNDIVGNTISGNSQNGVLIDGADDNIVRKNYIGTNSRNDSVPNGENGVLISGGAKNNIVGNDKEGNTIVGNTQSGVLLLSGENQVIGNNISDNSGSGVTLQGAGGNTITANYIESNSSFGVEATGSGNIIYNNYFHNEINASDSGNNMWHIAKVPGRNIVGGSTIAGNYWETYDGVDEDLDGIGDTPYEIDNDSADGLPLVLGIVNIDTDEYFETVQEAIDDVDTKDRHTILVLKTGVLKENIDISKSLTLKSRTGPEATIIEAAATDDHTVEIFKGNTSIEGFTIKGAKTKEKAGVYFKNSNLPDCEIKRCRITDNYAGVFVSDPGTDPIGETLMMEDVEISNNSHHGIYISVNNLELRIKKITAKENAIGISSLSDIYLRDFDISGNRDYGVYCERSLICESSDAYVSKVNDNDGSGVFQSLKKDETSRTFRVWGVSTGKIQINNNGGAGLIAGMAEVSGRHLEIIGNGRLIPQQESLPGYGILADKLDLTNIMVSDNAGCGIMSKSAVKITAEDGTLSQVNGNHKDGISANYSAVGESEIYPVRLWGEGSGKIEVKNNGASGISGGWCDIYARNLDVSDNGQRIGIDSNIYGDGIFVDNAPQLVNITASGNKGYGIKSKSSVKITAEDGDLSQVNDNRKDGIYANYLVTGESEIYPVRLWGEGSGKIEVKNNGASGISGGWCDIYARNLDVSDNGQRIGIDSNIHGDGMIAANAPQLVNITASGNKGYGIKSKGQLVMIAENGFTSAISRNDKSGIHAERFTGASWETIMLRGDGTGRFQIKDNGICGIKADGNELKARNIQVSGNGKSAAQEDVTGDGISTSVLNLVNAHIRTNANDGIKANVVNFRHGTVNSNGGYGIFARDTLKLRQVRISANGAGGVMLGGRLQPAALSPRVAMESRAMSESMETDLSEVSGSMIHDNSGDGIRVEGDIALTVTQSNIYDNAGQEISSIDTSIVTARENWWGSTDGPGNSDVSGQVDYSNWLNQPVKISVTAGDNVEGKRGTDVDAFFYITNFTDTDEICNIILSDEYSWRLILNSPSINLPSGDDEIIPVKVSIPSEDDGVTDNRLNLKVSIESDPDVNDSDSLLVSVRLDGQYGDIRRDDMLDLADILLGLKILTAAQDVGSDSVPGADFLERVDYSEIIYVLQSLSASQ